MLNPPKLQATCSHSLRPLPFTDTNVPPLEGPWLGSTPVSSVAALYSNAIPCPLKRPLSSYTSTTVRPGACSGDKHVTLELPSARATTRSDPKWQCKTPLLRKLCPTIVTSVPPWTGPLLGCIPNINPLLSYSNVNPLRPLVIPSLLTWKLTFPYCILGGDTHSAVPFLTTSATTDCSPKTHRTRSPCPIMPVTLTRTTMPPPTGPVEGAKPTTSTRSTYRKTNPCVPSA